MPTLSDSLLEDIDQLNLSTDPHDYVALFGYDPAMGYSCIARRVLDEEKALYASGDKTRAQLNRYLAAHLLEQFSPDAGPCKLPDSIRCLYPRELERISAQLQELDNNFFRLDHDPFVKDVAILSHRPIPLSAEYACPYAGVSRSLLFRAGSGQFLRGVKAVLFQAGGFRPYLELHSHVLALEDFNREGWGTTSLRLAELLELNPEFRGAISSSWFLDPQLKDISPRLSYLREDSIEQGATFLFSSVDEVGRSGALAKSATRRRLFDAGNYTPKIYTRVWPRSPLVAWKSKQATR